MTSLAERDFERILLVKPSSLGDIVHALPVLAGLRRRYPSAHIDWLVSRPLAPLLEAHPGLNEVVIFDRRAIGQVTHGATAARTLWALLGALRRRRYGLVVDLQGLFRSGVFSWATRAAVRLGFRRSRELAWLFYTDYIPEPSAPSGSGAPHPANPADVHAVDRNVAVGELLGFAPAPVAFALPLPERVRIEVAELLDVEGVSSIETDRGSFVAIVPGTRWETKRWPAARFAEVIDVLQAEGWPCVLAGAPDEAALCAEIVETCGTDVVNLAGRTRVDQFAGLLAASALVVCHDSAAAHLAVAFDRPLVCLIGPTNPARTGPYGRPESVVRLPLDCAPCYLRRLVQCPHQHRCLRELTVDTVLTAIRRALGSGQEVT